MPWEGRNSGCLNRDYDPKWQSGDFEMEECENIECIQDLLVPNACRMACLRIEHNYVEFLVSSK